MEFTSCQVRPLNIGNGSSFVTREASINEIQANSANGDSRLVPVLDVRGSKKSSNMFDIALPEFSKDELESELNSAYKRIRELETKCFELKIQNQYLINHIESLEGGK